MKGSWEYEATPPNFITLPHAGEKIEKKNGLGPPGITVPPVYGLHRERRAHFLARAGRRTAREVRATETCPSGSKQHVVVKHLSLAGPPLLLKSKP